VTFANQSSGEITDYLWDFGDSLGTSTDINPSYTFVNPGQYTITLTVNSTQGSASTQTIIIVNAAPPPMPTAAFIASVTEATTPLTVTFANQSSGEITDYLWDFGDSLGTSTDVNPTYTYGLAGSYAVSLKVTGPGGQISFQTVITVTSP